MGIETSYKIVDITKLGNLRTPFHDNDTFMVVRRDKGSYETFQCKFSEISSFTSSYANSQKYVLSIATEDILGGIRTLSKNELSTGNFGVRTTDEYGRAYVHIDNFKAVVSCTQEEYDKIQVKDENTLYCVTEEEKNLDWLNDIYPISSVYFTVSNENPKDIFKGFGTWEKLAEQSQTLGINAYKRTE